MKKYITLGITLILTGLWGGSWLCHIFPLDSGYSFASAMTGIIISLSGLVVIFVSLVSPADKVDGL